MEYLTHPYFDSSDRADWHVFPLSNDGMPVEGGDRGCLAEIIQGDFNQIVSVVVSRFRTCMPPDWLAECPHAMLKQVLYRPIDVTGMRIYVEHGFRPSSTENSHHTDHWWAIVHCPYVHGCPHTGRIEYLIEHLGWGADWMM